MASAVARTAVVAGTATADSGSVASKQARRHNAAAQQASEHAAKIQQMAEMQQQLDLMQTQAVQNQVAPQQAAAAPGDDMIAQLSRLGELHQQGILTAEEFAQAKTRLLNG